jgi:hypothetical protein
MRVKVAGGSISCGRVRLNSTLFGCLNKDFQDVLLVSIIPSRIKMQYILHVTNAIYIQQKMQSYIKTHNPSPHQPLSQ